MSAQPTPARLPTCIPVTWTAGGRYHLAYPRSPYDPDRYLIVRCPGNYASSLAGNTLAVVDDFGNLVETHIRGEMFFRPIGSAA
jgi:hypothetical protein